MKVEVGGALKQTVLNASTSLMSVMDSKTAVMALMKQIAQVHVEIIMYNVMWYYESVFACRVLSFCDCIVYLWQI